MKKTKILVPAIAVLALGLAASTTATVAWFTSSANASITDAANVAAGTLTVGESTKSMENDFTITPSAVNVSTNVAYTKNDGTTYVSVWNGQSYDEVLASTTAAKAVAITLKATVSYEGDLTDKASVEALWESTCSTVTLTVSCSAVGGSALAGTAQTSDIRGVSSAAANEAGDLSKSVGADQFTWSTAATTAELTLGTVYVALTGSNSLVVDADHLPTYTLQIAASHTLAA